MKRIGKIRIYENILGSNQPIEIGRRYNYDERTLTVSESKLTVSANTPIMAKQNAFKSTVLVGDIISQNKIYYPIPVLKDFVDVAFESVRQKRLLGYLEHPEDESISYYLANPKDKHFQITHYVYSLILEPDRVDGVFVLFDNVPDAQQVKSWLFERIPFGVSIRADVEVVETTPAELHRQGFRVTRRFYLENEALPLAEDTTRVYRAQRFVKVYGIDITLNPSVRTATVIYTSQQN